MSVINQMLKDLDARRRASDPPMLARALGGAGVGTAPPRRRRLIRAVALGAGSAAALLAVALVLHREAGKGDGVVPQFETVRPATATAEPTRDETVESTGPRRDEDPAAPMPGPESPTAAATPAPPAAPSGRVGPVPAMARETAAAPPPAPAAAPAPPPAPPRIERVAAPEDPLKAIRDALAAGDAEGALRALDAIAPADAGTGAPGEIDALRAAAFAQLGRHDAAIAAYRSALRRQPDLGAWWAGLGLSLEARGFAVDAQAAYREALRRGPLDAALADYVGARIDALATDDPARP